ncbi:hypothetical protein GBA52_001051 [Prunus armeniaca]|nr:hypothetical protein GBA52_001051 [Prunus armeniaca]
MFTLSLSFTHPHPVLQLHVPNPHPIEKSFIEILDKRDRAITMGWAAWGRAEPAEDGWGDHLGSSPSSSYVRRWDTCYLKENCFPTLLNMRDLGECVTATLTHVVAGEIGGHPATCVRPHEVKGPI